MKSPEAIRGGGSHLKKFMSASILVHKSQIQNNKNYTSFNTLTMFSAALFKGSLNLLDLRQDLR